MNDKVRLTGDLNAYDDAPAGTVLPRLRSSVDAERQARCHRACGIDGAIFGEAADVSLLTLDNARAIAEAGLPNDGRIHMRHVIRQRQRVDLGEPLVLNGRIAGYRPVRRGRVLTCLFAFLRPDLSVPLEMEGDYLLPYAEPQANEPRSAKADSDAPAFEEMARLDLQPETVAAYSSNLGNLIHIDPAFAQSRGFRAPIAQGVMLLTVLHGALVRTAGLPTALDVEVRFRRPVFWDQTIVIARDADGLRYQARDSDDRVAAEMTVQHLEA